MIEKDDYFYEKLCVDDLSDAERDAWFGLLTAEDYEKMAALKEHNREFLRRYPAASFLEGVRQQARERQKIKNTSTNLLGLFGRFFSRGAWHIKIITPIIACLALFFILHPLFRPGGGLVELGLRAEAEGGMLNDQSDDLVRTKGRGVGLLMYKKTAAGAERLGNLAVAYPGDTVQLSYFNTGKKYGVIFSFDGRGVLTRHFPLTGDKAMELKQNQEVLIPYSYQLDDAPAYEAFFLISTDRLFSIDTAMESLEVAIRDLEKEKDQPALLQEIVVGGMRVDTLILVKGER